MDKENNIDNTDEILQIQNMGKMGVVFKLGTKSILIDDTATIASIADSLHDYYDFRTRVDEIELRYKMLEDDKDVVLQELLIKDTETDKYIFDVGEDFAFFLGHVNHENIPDNNISLSQIQEAYAKYSDGDTNILFSADVEFLHAYTRDDASALNFLSFFRDVIFEPFLREIAGDVDEKMDAILGGNEQNLIEIFK